MLDFGMIRILLSKTSAPRARQNTKKTCAIVVKCFASKGAPTEEPMGQAAGNMLDMSLSKQPENDAPTAVPRMIETDKDGNRRYKDTDTGPLMRCAKRDTELLHGRLFHH